MLFAKRKGPDPLTLAIDALQALSADLQAINATMGRIESKLDEIHEVYQGINQPK